MKNDFLKKLYGYVHFNTPFKFHVIKDCLIMYVDFVLSV